jgi:hypothetical protein
MASWRLASCRKGICMAERCLPDRGPVSGPTGEERPWSRGVAVAYPEEAQAVRVGSLKRKGCLPTAPSVAPSRARTKGVATIGRGEAPGGDGTFASCSEAGTSSPEWGEPSQRPLRCEACAGTEEPSSRTVGRRWGGWGWCSTGTAG